MESSSRAPCRLQPVKVEQRPLRGELEDPESSIRRGDPDQGKAQSDPVPLLAQAVGYHEINRDKGDQSSELKQGLFTELEIRYWKKLLGDCRGNISRAARIAGVNRDHIFRIIKEYGLTKDLQ